MKIKNSNCDLLCNYKISKENIIKLKGLDEIDKASIVSDAMFKTMFISESRKKYSAYLISLIVDVPYDDLLKNMKLANNELEKDNIRSKGSICDYRADINKTTLNIEVNNNLKVENLERNLDYAFRLYAINTSRGSKYDYKQVIQINLNNFSYFNIEDIYTVNYIQNEKGIVLTDKIIIVNIYLPNLMKKCYTKGVKKLNELERYLYALVEYDTEKLKSITKEDKLVKEYVDESIEVTTSDNLREAYDHELANMEQQYSYGYDDGLEKGIEQGIEKGIKQGIEQGIEQGRTQGIEQGIEQKTREDAINLYNLGIEKSKITQALNITLEQLEEYLHIS